jgi:truncated hemoglobin YjbI
MQRAMQSPALDTLARSELDRERRRHRLAMEQIRPGERERFVEEFQRHMDRLDDILHRLRARVMAEARGAARVAIVGR